MSLPAVKKIWEPLEGSQSLIIGCPCNHILYEGTRGPGKCLDLDENVLTDRGWVKVKDVTFETKLIAKDGSKTSVLGIYNHTNVNMFELSFHSGSKVVACEDHRWLVKSGKNGKRDGWVVKTTKELVESRGAWSVPFMQGFADYGEVYEKFDPYVLGLIVGDGSTTGANVVVYTVDNFIADYLCGGGFKVYDYDYQNTMMVTADKKTSRYLRGILKFKKGLKAFGKQVPDDLMTSSPVSRLAVLQGLMDSDGSIERETGKQSFCTVSEKLANQVCDLVKSLGGWATSRFEEREGVVFGYEHGSRYRVSIRHNNKFNPFRLPRKRELVREQKKFLTNGIKSIKSVGKKEGVCFSVDHPDHCFVTTDYVVTHNTDAQLMYFRRFVGMGYGAFWRGVVFDREYKNLDDLISKSKRWFLQFGDGAKFISSMGHLKWVWPTGEELWFRVMKSEQDYWNYHGHEFPFIGWNELTKQPNPDMYDMAMSLNRSSFIPSKNSFIDHATQKPVELPELPLVVFSTTNPYGVGHNWVKERFIDPAPPGKVVKIEREVFNPRTQQRELVTKTQVRVFGSYKENIYLSPEYILELESIKDVNKRRAWLWGDWDITSGGMFDDVWSSEHNIVEPFQIPHSWRIFRSFDHGSARPFSVGWWAESDGCDVLLPNGKYKSTIRGDLFRIGEWYGWNGTANKGLRLLIPKIAKGIVERELHMGIYGRVKPGPGDMERSESGLDTNVERELLKKVTIDGVVYKGVRFTKPNKVSGSRQSGWEKLRIAIAQAQPEGGIREHPGLFVFRTCQDGFIRTVPTIPRDGKNLDDVDTDAEDHCADEVRYAILSLGNRFGTGKTTGYY